MNLNQRSVLAMSLVTIKYLDNVDGPIISNIPLFSSYYLPFKENVRLLDDELVLQMTNRKGYAVDKKDIKEEMCLLGNVISDKIVAYAVNENNSILENEVTFTYNDLHRLGDAECTAANQLIYDKAKLYLEVLSTYGIDDTMIAKLLVLIKNFKTVRPSPKNESIDKKMATKDIKDLFSANSTYLKKMDKLVKVLKMSNPEFVSRYFASRKLVKPAYRVLSARILVVDEAGNPVGKVLATNKGIGLKRRTTARGQMLLKHLEDLAYVLVFSKTDYVTQEVIVPVTTGERTEITVVMKRVES